MDHPHSPRVEGLSGGTAKSKSAPKTVGFSVPRRTQVTTVRRCPAKRHKGFEAAGWRSKLKGMAKALVEPANLATRADEESARLRTRSGSQARNQPVKRLAMADDQGLKSAGAWQGAASEVQWLSSGPASHEDPVEYGMDAARIIETLTKTGEVLAFTLQRLT
jgi:hypothetical protein